MALHFLQNFELHEVFYWSTTEKSREHSLLFSNFTGVVKYKNLKADFCHKEKSSISNNTRNAGTLTADMFGGSGFGCKPS